jgi:hypothetical protein
MSVLELAQRAYPLRSRQLRGGYILRGELADDAQLEDVARGPARAGAEEVGNG